MFKDYIFYFIAWEELKKKSINNNNNNSKVAEKTMTRISKVRSIIISISNPSAAITAAFTSQVDVHCV